MNLVVTSVCFKIFVYFKPQVQNITAFRGQRTSHPNADTARHPALSSSKPACFDTGNTTIYCSEDLGATLKSNSAVNISPTEVNSLSKDRPDSSSEKVCNENKDKEEINNYSYDDSNELAVATVSSNDILEHNKNKDAINDDSRKANIQTASMDESSNLM